MNLRSNKMLGLAIGERSILAAEVVAAAGEPRLIHAAEFVFTEAAGLQQPEALGQALGQFLKAQGFTTRPAVMGIPARWVLTKSKELPPSAPDVAADLLRLQAESDFSQELKDLVYDYAGEASSSEARQVLLMATLRRHVDQALSIAQGARLDVQAIAPTSVILSAATSRAAGDALVVSITPSATELSAQGGSGQTMLRHIGAAAAPAPAVAGEVRRAALLMPRANSSNGNGNGSAAAHPAGRVVVWDDVAPDAAGRHAVIESLGLGAIAGDLGTLGVGEVLPGVRGYAAAVSLAMSGLAEARPPVDFLHPRLAPPKVHGIHRHTILAIAAGVAVIAGVIFAYLDLQSKERALADLKNKLTHLDPTRKSAEAQVAMISQAQLWHAEKPRYLACLRDLTASVPEDGQLYVTSFDLHDNMKGAMSGKSTSNASVQTLIDRLKASKRFSEVKPSFDAQDKHGGREVSFSVSFKYSAQ